MATPIDYNYFINQISARRKPGLTRELTKRAYLAPKDSVSLAEGMPNDVTFPFEEIKIMLKDGSSFALKGQELNSALQYIPTQGYPPLVDTLKNFMVRFHDPPMWDDRDIILTSGSQDGISKSIEMCIEEGVPILVQNPLYTGAEIILRPYANKVELIGIDHDQHGMSAQKLQNILEDRKAKYTEEGGGCWKMPKVLYINPTGSNPAGTTMPAERRREIYNICCRFNILILEDDPYCFMHFLAERPPTFLSLDTEGRVLRFDSLSKVLSSGLRLGWITGPKQLIRNIELHIQSSYLHSSTLSQVITDKLLKTWGHDKLTAHLNFIREYYMARRDLTLGSMERHLKGLCDWTVPMGGMFVWIKVRGISDIYDMLLTRGLKKGVTFVPGHAFMADSTQACSHIRASYSKATPKQIDKAMKMLAELIREEQVLLRRKLENCT